MLLARPILLPGGEFGKAIRHSVLKLGVVGINANLFPGDSPKPLRQVQKETPRRRMDRARGLNAAPPRPVRWMSERISRRNFHRDPA